MIPPCFALSNIRYISRVKWSNPGKGVVPSRTPRCCSYWKGSLLVTLDYSCQLYTIQQLWETGVQFSKSGRPGFNSASLGDRGSIPGRVIPKTLKMVLDTSLLRTQQYKVHIKGKVEQSRERSSALGVVAIEKGAFWLPSTTVANFTQFSSSVCFCQSCQDDKLQLSVRC